MKTPCNFSRSLALCLALLAAHPATAQTIEPSRDAAGGQLLAGANDRIARYRMGALVVRVVDRRGRRVGNASVRIEQTRHAFLFGSNIFRLDPRDSSPQQLTYQQRFAALFNYATLPFYWGAFERKEGRPDYERLEAMARWCAAHGITTKGHPLVWQEVYPRWASGDPDVIVPLLRHRVEDLITRYRALIRFWDVVNEANAAAEFDNGVGHWVKRDGAASVVSTALSWARAAGAGETFIYNDYETGARNVALLTSLRDANSLPDAVGIQSHMHQGVWPLSRVWETCETFARFRRPVHFTEVTVVSAETRTAINYHGAPATDWPTTPAGEARQADYVVELYTLLFSHPSVRAITWWDLSDEGAWLGAPAGLLRRDMTPKPAYERLLALVRGSWWTRASGRTNGAGEYEMRVFLGSYKITVAGPSGRTRTVSAEVTRNEDGRNVVNVRL
ncbi:MAG TPA: endo-1,4-beta-xylanase [Pyrinomonadaceae bacterium]|nr:endo-1,4-beta-xylanase [Pyrinomonadaceae bacterium]